MLVFASIFGISLPSFYGLWRFCMCFFLLCSFIVPWSCSSAGCGVAPMSLSVLMEDFSGQLWTVCSEW